MPGHESPSLSPTRSSQHSRQISSSSDGAKLADKQWEQIQKKTFTKWVNTQYKKLNLPEMEDLVSEMSSGVRLIQLLEIIGGENFARYNKLPKLRIQKVENINSALHFIKARGVNLTNIGAEDIVDGNAKLVYGLIWMLILRFTINEISEGDLNAKDGLLLWCQRKTAGYKDVHVKDFTFSWQDGLAFCALIHRHRPDLIDFHSLNKTHRAENLALAFDVAEKHVGIPKLLDVEDIVQIAKPDERSIMTYVAQYFHAFSNNRKVDDAGRRIGKFTAVIQSAFEMQNDYEARVRTLSEGIADTTQTWTTATFDDTYADAKQQLTAFESYKVTTKRAWVTEKRALDTLLGNIQTKRSTYKLKPYVPPAGLGPNDVELVWSQLLEDEMKRRKLLTQQMRHVKEGLRVRFAELANQFMLDLNAISATLAALPQDDLEAQLAQVRSLAEQLEDFVPRLEQVREASQLCEAAGLDDNEHTVYALDDLEFDFGLVRHSVQKKASFIDNQIAARNMTNITPQQLEEFEATFKYFDKDNSNTLAPSELRAALTGLDIHYSDEEFPTVFARISQKQDFISFQQFVSFMMDLSEDRTTHEQLRESFRVLKGQKDYVSEQELRAVGLSQENLSFIKSAVPQLGDGYDFESYLDHVFDLENKDETVQETEAKVESLSLGEK